MKVIITVGTEKREIKLTSSLTTLDVNEVFEAMLGAYESYEAPSVYNGRPMYLLHWNDTISDLIQTGLKSETGVVRVDGEKVGRKFSITYEL